MNSGWAVERRANPRQQTVITCLPWLRWPGWQ